MTQTNPTPSLRRALLQLLLRASLSLAAGPIADAIDQPPTVVTQLSGVILDAVALASAKASDGAPQPATQRRDAPQQRPPRRTHGRGRRRKGNRRHR